MAVLYTQKCVENTLAGGPKFTFHRHRCRGCATADGDDDGAGVLSVVSRPRMPSFHHSKTFRRPSGLTQSPPARGLSAYETSPFNSGERRKLN